MSIRSPVNPTNSRCTVPISILELLLGHRKHKPSEETPVSFWNKEFKSYITSFFLKFTDRIEATHNRRTQRLCVLLPCVSIE